MQKSMMTDLLLDGELYAHTFTVWFGPYEASVYKSDFFQAFQPSQADSEQFSAFELCDEPSLGRAQPSIAVSTEG
jgi:hypothetical protein